LFSTRLICELLLTIVFGVFAILQLQFVNIDELKCKRLREWSKLDDEIIASAIRQSRHHLRACETADGGHFEQAF